MDVIFFPTPYDFRIWLKNNHAIETVLWVGYYKKAAGKPSITWPESVDEALCYGWIDGLRKSIDSEAYKIRFTPRKARSHWSEVNIKRIPELIREGRMQKPGLVAFERRTEGRSRQAAYEQKSVKLPEEYINQIKENSKAWAYFKTLSPYYLKASCWYVISAKQEKTREKRLGLLISSCEKEEKLPQFQRK